MNEQKVPTVVELIEKGETELLSNQAKANTISHNVYQTIAVQLVKFAELSNQREVEIQRLQELLRQNNIQFILPPKPVKLPENMAVIPEIEIPETTTN